METLVALQVEESPEHSVLPNAKKYDVRELRLHWTGGSIGATLELEVSTHSDYDILRFYKVWKTYSFLAENPLAPCCYRFKILRNALLEPTAFHLYVSEVFTIVVFDSGPSRWSAYAMTSQRRTQ